MRFAAGLPEQTVRALTGAERARVVRARLGCYVRGATAMGALLVGFWLVPASHWVGVELLNLRTVAASAVAPVLIGVLVVLGGIPVTTRLVREALRAARALERDLVEREVIIFGSPGKPTLAVLRNSRRVIGLHEELVTPYTMIEIAEAAVVPNSPPTYGVPVDLLPERMLNAGWVRRALTKDEKDELGAHAIRARKAPLWLLVGSVLIAGFVSGSWSRFSERPWLFMGAAGWAMFLLLAWWRVLQSKLAARALLEDAAEGWVLRATRGALAGREVLPRSRVVWSNGSSPAPWRLSGQVR